MHIQVSSEPTAPLLKTGIQHIIQEANCIQPGSLCLLTRLVELMFIEILRNYIQNSPNEQIGGYLQAIANCLWCDADDRRNSLYFTYCRCNQSSLVCRRSAKSLK